MFRPQLELYTHTRDKQEKRSHRQSHHLSVKDRPRHAAGGVGFPRGRGQRGHRANGLCGSDLDGCRLEAGGHDMGGGGWRLAGWRGTKEHEESNLETSLGLAR